MNIKPDWNKLDEKLDNNLSQEELNTYWTKECKNWLDVVANHYGSEYRVEKTDNFFILSNESKRYIELFSQFIERTLKRILFTLKGMAADQGYGQYVVMIFQNPDDYYNYLEIMYPQGSQIGFSAGVFINQGYGHFVFPSQNIEISEPIAVHELTHACLAHLPIPLWLNEGLAVLMEEVLAGQELHIDKHTFNRHRQYWNNETIQNFWSGDSFHATDDSQELSYHLAHIIARNLAKDTSSFSVFVNHAHYQDAGSKAALEILGYSLSDIVGSFLGDGHWNQTHRIIG